MPEPVIPQIPKEDLDQDLRQVFDTGIERTGDATIIGVMAQQPDILRWYFSQFYDGLFYNENPGYDGRRSDKRIAASQIVQATRLSIL